MGHISLELTDDVLAIINRTAEERGVSASEVVSEAMLLFSTGEAALEAAIAEGEADLAAGRVVPFEDVMRELEEKIAAAEARQR